MTKFTTLSAHIGDGNHLYEVGEPRESDEPVSLTHLITDKVLGPYDAEAEKAWRDMQAAKAEPATKLDADAAQASLASGTGGDLLVQVETLTKERDAAQSDLAGMINERDSARNDLTAAQSQVETLTKGRDDLKAKLAAKPAARGA